MSDAKHSPLPWQVVDRRSAPLKNVRILDAVGNWVADIEHVHQRDTQAGFTPDKNEQADAYDAIGLANARRIVACVNSCEGINPEAAPDLLAACKLWDQGFTEGEEFTPEQLLAWMNANRRAARAAIAKAEGR